MARLRPKAHEDLLARINLWTFLLPGLQDRPEDIEPNLNFELDQFAQKTGRRVTFNKEARERLLLRFRPQQVGVETSET